jgi:PAS domain S-box-containing protein
MNIGIYEALLDTVNSPIVFVDNDHVIRYLNRAAKIRYYEKRGYTDLIGKSLFDCHNAESEKQVRQIHSKLSDGENEVFLKMSDNNEKITVIAVRDADGKLIGYYERFE